MPEMRPMKPSLSLVSTTFPLPPPTTHRRRAHGQRPGSPADFAKAVGGVQGPGGIGRLHAKGDGADPATGRCRRHGLQQARPDSAASPSGQHGDRQLGHVLGDEAIAGVVGRKATDPHGPDRPAADLGDDAEILRSAPSVHVVRQLRIGEYLRRGETGALWIPPGGFLEHLSEEAPVVRCGELDLDAVSGVGHACWSSHRAVVIVNPGRATAPWP